MDEFSPGSDSEFTSLDNHLESAQRLLVIHVGNFVTQAMLFDSVENQYRMLANCVKRSNVPAVQRDLVRSIKTVINDLEQVTSYRLLDDYQQVIKPVQTDGSGVDAVAATFSAGKPLKTTAIGLLKDLSGKGATQLARTTYSEEPAQVSLSEHTDQVEIIAAIEHSQPEMILFAGGSDGGAGFGVNRLIECIQMSCQLMSPDQRPLVIYAGNRYHQNDIHEQLSGTTNYRIAPNILSDGDTLDSQAAITIVSESTISLRRDQFPGLEAVDRWMDKQVLNKPAAFGRVIHFLSKARSPEKGVLGVDIDESALILATAHGGKLNMSVLPQFSIPNAIDEFIQNQRLIAKLLHWLPIEIYAEDVLEYLLNKQSFPASLPSSPEEEMIEGAYARMVLQMANDWLKDNAYVTDQEEINSQANQFEPILVSGDLIFNRSSLAASLLILLDGLQPTAATTFVLDQNNLISALGAAAEINPTITLQVLSSNSFTHLGTVISPLGKAKPGTPILRARFVDEDGYQSTIELKQGMLDWIPLERGRTARIRLDPLQNVDIGMGGPGVGGSLLVKGGARGIIFDGRGRPVVLDLDPAKRRNLHIKWIQSLEG